MGLIQQLPNHLLCGTKLLMRLGWGERKTEPNSML